MTADRVDGTRNESQPVFDMMWIGNWGDDERAAELEEFLIEPVRRLGLTARIHGVRYPSTALSMLERAGLEYCGWLCRIFAFAVHIPSGCPAGFSA